MELFKPEPMSTMDTQIPLVVLPTQRQAEESRERVPVRLEVVKLLHGRENLPIRQPPAHDAGKPPAPLFVEIGKNAHRAHSGKGVPHRL